MVHPKASSKKQRKSGIDFKKIKRKIGKKLPPPKNATDTKIKSKAIILPEQSVASEKAGLAVSKKGLTLKELLLQTSHHNHKIRRDALMGIKDLFLKYPAELKLHKYTVIEKLRERIIDDDGMVRETLYHLFKSVVFPSCKEDGQGPLISLMMAHIFIAMAHLAIDVRVMSFKFLDLVVQNYPPSFSSHAEKILQNYEDMLRKNQYYLQNRGNFKNAIAGLMRCLSLLPCDKREVETSSKNDTAACRILHAFESDAPEDSAGFSVIAKKLKDLIPVLVSCFLEFIPLVRTSQLLDALSFDSMLYILKSIDVAVRFFVYGIDKNCRPELQVFPPFKGPAPIWGQMISPVLLKKLWDVFPLKQTDHFSEKDGDRYFILNIIITEIFLRFSEWISPSANLLENFLVFIESAFSGKISRGAWSEKSYLEKHVISLLPFLPKLVSQVESNWRSRLLQEFTKIFISCKPQSSLKLACLSTIEEMLVLLQRQGMFLLDASDPEMLSFLISWIRELPSLLIQLDDQHPLCSRAALHLQLRVGQCALMNSSLALEYDNLQHSLQEFYCSFPNEGTVSYGPFMKLSQDSQELSVCGLYYFTCLDSVILKSLVSCCLCHDLEPFVLFRIIEVLDSAYKAGHIQITDHISFFMTLVSRFRVLPEKIHPALDAEERISSHKTFKSITSVIYSCLSQIGDDSLLFQIVERVIFDQMSLKLPIDNVCAMLRILVMLDSSPSRISEGSIINLSNFLSCYLIKVAYCVSEDEDESAASSSLHKFRYYILPCFFLFERSHKLLHLVLSMMGSLILGNSSSFLSCTSDLDASDHPSRIDAIVSVILLMHKEVRLQMTLASSKADIDGIIQKIRLLLSSGESNMTIEGRHKIQCALDRLKNVTDILSSAMQIS